MQQTFSGTVLQTKIENVLQNNQTALRDIRVLLEILLAQIAINVLKITSILLHKHNLLTIIGIGHMLV